MQDEIDVDDPASWPGPILRWATSRAASLRGTASIAEDLRGTLSAEEDDLRLQIAPRKLLAVHCTRLLDHEIAAIRNEGLRPLTSELVAWRIDEAHSRGFLTDDERDELTRFNVFATGTARNRERQVCLTLGRALFEDAPADCADLLSTWGGEAIYRAGIFKHSAPRSLGVPSIVVAGIDLSASHRISPTWPEVTKVLVGRLLDLEKCWADVHLRSPAGVPPEDVIAIWTPGHAEYDRHASLPRS